MFPATPSLPPSLPFSLHFSPFALTFLFCDARISSVPGYCSRTGSWPQICVVTAAGFKNLRPCTGQQQLHSYRVPKSEYLANSSEREGWGGLQWRDIKNPDPKHKNASVFCKCQQNVILALILSPAWESLNWDPGTQMHTHMLPLTHKDFQHAEVRTFLKDLHYCYSAETSFYDTLVACVLAVHVVFTGGTEAYRQKC